jgi:Tol biopolymer transport system component
VCLQGQEDVQVERPVDRRLKIVLAAVAAFGGLVFVWVLPYLIAAATLGVVCPWTPPGVTDPGWKCPEGPGRETIVLGRPNPALRGLGKLAFVGYTGHRSSTDIFVVNADGTGLQNLTDEKRETFWEPAWSPDGTQLALVGNHEYADARRLDVLDVGTGVVTELTHGEGIDHSPAWSPDGSTIAFESSYRDDQPDGRVEIYALRGNTVAKLTSEAVNVHPTWSPDGTTIAFSGGDESNRDIYAMGADGAARRNLTTNPAFDQQPAWSPDGTMIAFTSDPELPTQIYIMNSDGSAARQLTDTPGEKSDPTWSPDGTKIAFLDHDDQGIYVADLAGGPPRLILTGVDNDGGLSWQHPAAVPDPD